MGLIWGRVCASRGCEAECVVRALVLGNRGLTESCIRVWARQHHCERVSRGGWRTACAGAKGDREVPLRYDVSDSLSTLNEVQTQTTIRQQQLQQQTDWVMIWLGEVYRRATRSRMIELTVRIASAATAPPCACICGQVL